MKQGKTALLFLLFLSCFVSASWAADIYVQPSGQSGAPGCQRGGDWTNANSCSTITAANSVIQRGDTVYIAGGTYGTATLNPGTGTTLTYYKKATATSHGTETGWQASFGASQAVFTITGSGTIISAPADYVVFDGQEEYGIKVYKPNLGTIGADSNIISVSGDNVTLQYIEVEGPGGDSYYCFGATTGDSNDASRHSAVYSYGTSYLTVRHFYVHKMQR